MICILIVDVTVKIGVDSEMGVVVVITVGQTPVSDWYSPAVVGVMLLVPSVVDGILNYPSYACLCYPLPPTLPHPTPPPPPTTPTQLGLVVVVMTPGIGDGGGGEPDVGILTPVCR